MVGITSYGAYIPRRRLNRMAIFQAMGWFAPAIMMVAQGERAMCNWDEDTMSMAVSSAWDCIRGFDRSKIDAVYMASTTLPFEDRQNAGIVKAACNLRDEVLTADFSGSQKAATSAAITALESIKSGDKKNILLAASDHRMTKAAYFYEMWFGDGSASLLLGDDNVIAEYKGSHSVSVDFVDHYRGSGGYYDYMWEERWVRDEGFVKIMPDAIKGLMTKLSIDIKDIKKVVFPCLFMRERGTIMKEIGADRSQDPGNLHDVLGETGTAHPFMMLAKELETAEPGDKFIVVGWGQGCDTMLFEVTDAIKDLKPRNGFSGSLANREEVTQYTKYLKFRELMEVEMGIRAEAAMQTCLSTLYRNRKMIFGLVGGKCTKCGTPQFPASGVCVKPDCNHFGPQDDYEFANIPAKVVAVTGDMLAVSVEPPAVYGMIDFEGGGRMPADFTDCELHKVKVGQPVTVSFRKRYFDKKRGFTGYFWKAIPDTSEGGN
jgi:3-hydroxy-3-methylglutaryl CoA synthase